MDGLSGNSVLRYLIATPQRRDDGLNLRAWFAFYVLYLAGICCMAHWGFAAYAAGAAWGKTVWLLAVYIFYFSVVCTYIPLPTLWLILLLASPAGGLTALDQFWRVIAVTACGSLATGISNTNEYYFISYLLRLGRIHRIRETKVYQWAREQFHYRPFLILVLFNILPMAVDPARWMAIISRYSRPRFFLAQWLGRFIRYIVFALCGAWFQVTLLQSLLVTVVVTLCSAVIMLVQRIRQRRVQDTVMPSGVASPVKG
jgi:membrane protein YqaA with SNARE-associated domain